jgi:hypothetical protein
MSYDETNLHLHYIKLIMITTLEHAVTAGYTRACSDRLSLPGGKSRIQKIDKKLNTKQWWRLSLSG